MAAIKHDIIYVRSLWIHGRAPDLIYLMELGYSGSNALEDRVDREVATFVVEVFHIVISIDNVPSV